ncbi:hypothetical protein FACS1894122_01130 [Alphaproteobacteria bacterium]|nr:hypothetical protein FACS1894122_01130 [Alphaproteobacteria bacterium]
MNKALITCSSLVLTLFFSANASLTVADWYSFLYGDGDIPQQKPTYFDESTDLINGQVLLSSGLVKNHRFFGPAEYNRFYEKNQPASYLDTSEEPMTALLIKLFPSAGISLNVEGRNGIKGIISNGAKASTHEHNELIKFIAKMFAIANFVRKNNLELNDISIEQIYACANSRNLKTKGNADLGEILNTIASAVKQERIESDESSSSDYKKSHPYPHEYTNYLISAYAWKVLDKPDIELLERELSKAVEDTEIAFHGSAVAHLGGILNVEGNGGINVIISDTVKSPIDKDKELIKFIAKMSAIANFVRKNNLELNDISREQIYAYANSTNLDAEGNANLGEILNTIASAVKQERIESDESSSSYYKKSHPYPREYINYLISTYARKVLDKANIELLERELSKAVEDTEIAFHGSTVDRTVAAFDSLITKSIRNYEKSYTQYMPLRPTDSIIANGIAMYNKNSFADCVETELRQFCTMLFCKENNGKLSIENKRLPLKTVSEAASKLWDFFNKENVDVSEYANDGRTPTRSEWAKIVSGRQEKGIAYSDGQYNLQPGWINFIKVFCRLMDGYKAPRESGEAGKRAQETIESVNREDTFKNSSLVTPQYILNVLNTIIGMRDDVTLVARIKDEDIISKKDEPISGNDLYCTIQIRPVPISGLESDIKNNTMDFTNNDGHGQAYMRDGKEPEKILSNSIEWIKLLYNDWIAENNKEKSIEKFANYMLLQHFLLLHRGSPKSLYSVAASDFFKKTKDGILRGVKETVFEFCTLEPDKDGSIWRNGPYLKAIYQPKRIKEVSDAVDKLTNISKEYTNDAYMILYNTERKHVVEAAIKAIIELQQKREQLLMAAEDTEETTNGDVTSAVATTKKVDREEVHKEIPIIISQQKEIANAALDVLHINKSPISVEEFKIIKRHINSGKDNVIRIIALISITNQADADFLIDYVLEEVSKIAVKKIMPEWTWKILELLLDKIERLRNRLAPATPRPMITPRAIVKINEDRSIKLLEYAGWKSFDKILKMKAPDVDLIDQDINISLIESANKNKDITSLLTELKKDPQKKISLECTKYLLRYARGYNFGLILEVSDVDLTNLDVLKKLADAAATDNEIYVPALYNAALKVLNNIQPPFKNRINNYCTRYLLCQGAYVVDVLSVTDVNCTEQKGIESLISNIRLANQKQMDQFAQKIYNAIPAALKQQKKKISNVEFVKYLLQHASYTEVMDRDKTIKVRPIPYYHRLHNINEYIPVIHITQPRKCYKQRFQDILGVTDLDSLSDEDIASLFRGINSREDLCEAVFINLKNRKKKISAESALFLLDSVGLNNDNGRICFYAKILQEIIDISDSKIRQIKTLLSTAVNPSCSVNTIKTKIEELKKTWEVQKIANSSESS